MSIIVFACALVCLWWPEPVATLRLREITSVRSRASPVLWSAAPAVLPIVAISIGGLAAAVAASVVAGLIFRWWCRRRATRTADHATAELMRALSVMIAELGVGAPAVRACAAAADELTVADGSSSVAAMLRTMVGRAELGGDVFAGPVDGLDGPWRRVALVWRAADDLGLPLVDLLSSVRADVAARQRFGERTRAALAGPRATAGVLAALPVLGIALGQMMGADPLGVLFGGGLGGVLLVVGTILAAGGLVWSERITDRAVAQ